MKYSRLFLTIPMLLLVGAFIPFIAFAHYGEHSEAHACQVSYNEGKTWKEGKWNPEDPNRVCRTDKDNSESIKHITSSFPRAESAPTEIQKINETIITRSSNLDKKTFKRLRLKLLERELEERKEKMLEFAEESPSLFARNSFSLEEIATIPSSLQNFVEQPIKTSGEFWSVEVETFDDTAPAYKYFLAKDGKQFIVHPPAQINEVIEEQVTIEGYQLLDHIVITSFPTIRTLDLSNNPIIRHSVGILPPKRVAVFLLEYPDSPSRPFSSQQAHDFIFDGNVNDFFKEQSYNRFEFTGDVFGWVSMSGITTCMSNDPMLELGSGQDLDQFIALNNINLQNYDTVLFLGTCPMGTPTTGYASVGPRTYTVGNGTYQITPAVVFINGPQVLQTPHTGGRVRFSQFDHVVAHELGHTLGIAHANHYDCGPDAYSIGCQSREYGNMFDTMGYGRYATHFTASVKERLGWLLPREIISITQPGTYTLAPLEIAGVGAKIAKVKIPGTNFSPYYVEFRKGIGFDDSLNDADLASNQNGALITRIHNGNSYGVSSLLDLSPDTPPGTFDQDLKKASLNSSGLAGPSFQDARNGITIGPIMNIAQSANAVPLLSFNASVTPATCVHSAPVFRSGYSVNNYAAGYLPKFSPGETLTFFGWYTNADSLACGPSAFTFTQTADVRWAAPLIVYAPVINALLPEGEAGYLSSSLVIPLGTPPGIYPVSITLRNDASGLSSSISVPIEVE